MLTPMVACIALVLSFMFPYLGMLLVVESHKDDEDSTHLTLRTKQDRLRWAALGWVIVVIGAICVPVPYVIMALAGEGWYIIIFLLGCMQCCMMADDSFLPSPKKTIKDSTSSESEMA